ncbi:CBS domain-containing protein [Acidianus brierleyi]|uniref:Signal transduction protein n=1 Tax=Acidianus brierleyi TaxID=41673 RepID=A0A2U9IIL5_9CREN|nr:CBS domain-containing protein [Acidianus brierleyi]AWR95815.1 CBS domain-containing protein [Acidianus brierleyi]
MIIKCNDNYVPNVIIDVDRCVGCYMCQRACALAKCIQINNFTNIAEVIDPNDCTGCMACERSCPYNCISVINYMDPLLRAKIVISRVKRFMRSPVITVEEDHTIREGAKIMVSHNIASLIVNNSIVTESDILSSDDLNKELKYIAKEAICIDGLCEIYKALETMTYYQISHLPVVSNDRIVGMISFRDILRANARSSIIKDDRYTYIQANNKIKLLNIAESVDVLDYTLTLREAIDIMMKNRMRALILKKSNKLGIFTYRDAIKMIAQDKNFDDFIEGRFDVKIFRADDELNSLIPWIIEKNNRHAIVVSNDNVLLLSVKDIVGRSIWIQRLNIK